MSTRLSHFPSAAPKILGGGEKLTATPVGKNVFDETASETRRYGD
jgi:hypothetical protein